MQKILIVDDEKLARSDILYKVSRSGFQFDWIMEAASAEEALKIIRENKPDILLTDIIMDGKSGIDLIRAANEIRPEMVSVIICGHAEFTFAQEAISLNVIDYILKPVRQEKLSSALSKAIVEILHRNNLMHLSVRNDLLEEKLSYRKLQENLFAFLNAAHCGPDFSITPLFPPDSRFFQICLLRVSLRKGKNGTANEFTEADYDLLRYGIQNIIHELAGDRFLSFNNFGEARQITIIGTSPTEEEGGAFAELRRTIGKIHCSVTRYLGVALHIGVSLPERKLAGTQLSQAKQALDLRLCLETSPAGNVFFYGDYAGRNPVVPPEAELKLYKKFLDSSDLGNTLKTVRRILDSPVCAPDLYLRMAYVEMICILARSCFKKGVAIFSFLGSECISGTVVDQFETKRELVENLCSIITTALNQWLGSTGDVNNVLKNVKASIESNFTESELCTKLLSSRFCISLGYLSASYKKAFGITISKYIISLRMEYAAGLLRTTDLPVITISENSGFNNLSYFLRVFRKYYNLTPTEYRKLNKA